MNTQTKKKLTALVCTSVLLLASCGGGKDEEQKVTTEQPSFAASPEAILASTLTVESVTIRPRAIETALPGESIQLSATVTFSDGLQQISARRFFFHAEANVAGHLIWTSSDEDIATVSRSGLVEIHRDGQAVIRCTNPWIPNFPSDAITLVTPTLDESADESPPAETPPEEIPDPSPSPLPEDADPFADNVVSYFIGEQGGFNEDQLPHIVLGPPYGGGCCQGSFDVFSLGIGGEIILEFADFIAFDGEGFDFIVFENGFQVGTDPENIFSEPGIVSVSQDGATWHEFSCDLSGPPYTGCAGTQPTFANPDANEIDPTDLSEAGGNGFDLADVGLEWARFVKITDSGLSIGPIGPNTGGFDLDAVVIINARAP